MTDHPEEYISIKDYLLGQLSERDRRQVEERLLTDELFFDEIAIAEEELIDQFLDGGLDRQEAERFRENFLATPERHENLRFAKALRRYVSDNQPASDSPQDAPGRRPARRAAALFSGGHRRWAVPALAAVLAIALLSVIWSLFAGRGAALVQEVARLNGQGARLPQPAVSLTLNANRTRESGEMQSLTPGSASVIQLRLVVARDEYEDYSASLKPVGGQKVVTVDHLKRTPVEGRDVVALNLPAGLLKRGDYEVELSGATPGAAYETVGVYFFRVTGN